MSFVITLKSGINYALYMRSRKIKKFINNHFKQMKINQKIKQK